MFKKKQVDRICKNCRLYNDKDQVCSVVVLFEGKKLHVPMDPQDTCLYENQYFDPTTESLKSMVDDIKQLRMWVEDENGQKSKEGIVKIEFPDDLEMCSEDDDE